MLSLDLFSRLCLSGAGRSGAGIFRPDFPPSVCCWFGSDAQADSWHSEHSIISPWRDFSTYHKTLQAKFVTFLPQPVLLARWAPVSLRLHLRGAGNSSFSPYPPKILGGGSPAKWGEEEPDKLLPALSVPEGKRFFSACCSDPVRWIRTTFIAPRQPNLPLLSERKIHKGENPASSYNPAWIISWSFKWLCLWFWGAD